MARTITTTPEQELDSAFDELDRANAALQASQKAEREAHTHASEVSGLVADARRELKNAEARHRVLSSAASAKTKDLQKKKQQLERDIAATDDELKRTEKAQEEADKSKNILDEMVKAVQQGITAAQAAENAVKDARSETESAEKKAPEGKKAALKNAAETLGTKYEELRGQVTKLGDYLDRLQAEDKVLRTAATRAGARARSLSTRKQRLEKDLEDVSKSLAGLPGGDISQSEAELKTAQSALEDAPDIERRAQDALQEAREAREAAEKRYREAQERRDEAEQRFIAGIDV